MNKLLTVLLLCFTFKSFAQISQTDVECATSDLDSAHAVALPYYNNNQIIENYLISKGYDDLNEMSLPSTTLSARGEGSTFLEPKFLIPINIFIYRNSAGNASSAISEVVARELICMVNETFRDANTSIQFYVNHVGIENNETYRSGATKDLTVFSMWSSKRGGTPSYGKGINVHFIAYNGDDKAPAGKASGPQFVVPFTEYSLYVRTHINPIGSIRDPGDIEGTLSHELGHVLGLLHTHHPGRFASNLFNEQNGTISNGCYQESVSRTRQNKWYQGCLGSNGSLKCEINGDFLCDTDGDPRQTRITNSSCVYDYNNTSNEDYVYDNWDARWMPPTRNVMSYTRTPCRIEFTRSQIGIMWMEIPRLQNFLNYLNPSATGSTLVCSNTSKNYTLNNIPSDANVTWVATPSNLVQNSSGIGNVSTLRGSSASAQGFVELIFTFSGVNNCYVGRVKKDKIWIGKPAYANSFIQKSGTDQYNFTYSNAVQYYTYIANGATSYKWYITTSQSCGSGYDGPYFYSNGGGTIATTSQNKINVNTGTCDGDFYVRCEAVNTCGIVSYSQRLIRVNSSGGGGGTCNSMLTAHPNPVKRGNVIVDLILPPDDCSASVLSEDTMNSRANIEEITCIEVFDHFGNYIDTNSCEEIINEINIDGQSNGIYFINATTTTGTTYQTRLLKN